MKLSIFISLWNWTEDTQSQNALTSLRTLSDEIEQKIVTTDFDQKKTEKCIERNLLMVFST